MFNLVAIFTVVAAGLGASCRYLVTVLAEPLSKRIPWGTLLINWIGSLGMGIVSALGIALTGLAFGIAAAPIIIGFLGGFTTFSAMSVETLNLFQTRQYYRGVTYALGTAVGAVFLCIIGFTVTLMNAAPQLYQLM